MLEEKYAISERGKTYYFVSGCGSDINLVFLPGLTADHRLFEKQTEYFSGKYNVLVWDCPAHGKSRPYSDFSYFNVTSELKNILDAEGMEKAVFIGQSLGGMIAQYFISRFPSMAEGFVSIDSAPFGDYYSRSDMFWLEQLEWMCSLFPDKLLRVSMAKLCGESEYARSQMLEMLSVYSKKELCHLMYIGEAAFIPENMKIDIPCKVTLILGEKDRVGKVAQYNRKWSENTGYPLKIIKDAAHNSNADQPEKINNIIEEMITH